MIFQSRFFEENKQSFPFFFYKLWLILLFLQEMGTHLTQKKIPFSFFSFFCLNIFLKVNLRNLHFGACFCFLPERWCSFAKFIFHEFTLLESPEKKEKSKNTNISERLSKANFRQKNKVSFCFFDEIVASSLSKQELRTNREKKKEFNFFGERTKTVCMQWHSTKNKVLSPHLLKKVYLVNIPTFAHFFPQKTWTSCVRKKSWKGVSETKYKRHDVFFPVQSCSANRT